MKLKCIITAIYLFLVSFNLYAQQNGKLICEVMEIGETRETTQDPLRNIHYMVIHHAKAEERDIFSKWLRGRKNNEIVFYFNGREHKGIIFRLSHCFGRGLIIFTEDIYIKEKDIIEINID